MFLLAIRELVRVACPVSSRHGGRVSLVLMFLACLLAGWLAHFERGSSKYRLPRPFFNYYVLYSSGVSLPVEKGV